MTELDIKIEKFMQELTSWPVRLTAVVGAIPLIGWRWFRDEDWLVLEPPEGIVDARTMSYLDRYMCTHEIQAVLRTTPHAGVYLRFKLRTEELP